MTPRQSTGAILIALGFLLILLLGYGVIEPFGSLENARTTGDVLTAVAPSLLVPFAIFLVGLWLVKSGRRR